MKIKNHIIYNDIFNAQAAGIDSSLGSSKGTHQCTRMTLGNFVGRNRYIAIYREGIDLQKPWFLDRRFTKCMINGQIIWINTNSFCKRFNKKKSDSETVHKTLSELEKTLEKGVFTRIDFFHENRPSLIFGNEKYVFWTKSETSGDKVLGIGTFKTAKIASRVESEEEKSQAVVLIAKRGERTEAGWEVCSKQLERELEIMKELKEAPFTLKLLAHYKRDGFEARHQKYYMVVEKGTDMRAVLEQNPERLQKGQHSYQMAASLAYLHEKGMIHRDVKLANFILLDKGEIALSDFGATCKQEDKASLLQYVCTYPAPEQAKEYYEVNGNHRLKTSVCTTPKVDSWALGCALYSMHHKSTKASFMSGDWDDILLSTQELTQAQVDRRLNNIPNPAYREIIRGLLQIDPENRTSTSDAAAQLLKLI